MSNLDRYFDAVAAIRATGTSRDGWIKVVRAPDGDIDVQIRPGMLRTCTAQEVAAEIRTGLIAAVADHRRQYRQLRINYFGTPLGAELMPPIDDTTETTRFTGQK
ncbi:hypothetical protein [Krasilnikovia sp. MM14-A1259]|uniref:hypothetical protein n=1 Tax=Krasilnikovia sp. MM14-A1259 TaxID=3373539 RepID=UPI0037FD4200